MSAKCAVAAATLVAALAGPAFGETRILRRRCAAAAAMFRMPTCRSGTRARCPPMAMRRPKVLHVPAHAFASAVTPALRAPIAPTNDFQLQGR